MLNNLRNFSKTKLAGVLVIIIVIPFVFWGMGSVFSGGNTNSVAKINNKNISTQDFIKFVNESNINPNDLRNNLNDKLLQDILSQIVSINLLTTEVEDTGVILTDKSLLNKLTNEMRFLDEKNNFSRIKYEKFLLENNISAYDFEKKVKESEKQKDLFQYISGGIKSPDFLVKNFYLEETKEIEIEYLNLEKFYKSEFTDKEIEEYISNNEESLKIEILDIIYAEIKPEDITNSNEFNSDFFKKIDEIENDIINGEGIDFISNKYGITTLQKNGYQNNNDHNETIFKKIYELRNNEKIQLIDNEEYYLLFEIKNKRKILPDLNNENFFKLVLNKLRSSEKFNYNKNILKNIELNQFKDKDFYEISSNKEDYKKIIIKSKDDNSFFNIDSLNLLYTIPKNDYLLIVDNDKSIYLTKIINYEFKNIVKNDNNFKKYFGKSNLIVRNHISQTYDKLINEKYKVVINYNTLDRLKNFFK